MSNKYPHQAGTWTMIAPDGRQWTGDSPLRCASAEARSRIPPEVALDRIFSEAHKGKFDDAMAVAHTDICELFARNTGNYSPTPEEVDAVSDGLDQIISELAHNVRPAPADQVDATAMGLICQETSISSNRAIALWRKLRTLPSAGCQPHVILTVDDQMGTMGMGPVAMFTSYTEAAKKLPNGIYHLYGIPAPRPQEGAPPGFVKPDNDRQVFFYEQEFYVLSNFSAFSLQWAGLAFPTSEHAYHWEKFNKHGWKAESIRSKIMAAPSAHAAFKLAEEYREKRRDDWDSIKVATMADILRAKVVQHEYVRRKLLATGDRELIEDSWRDDFWGWGPNRDGQNMLGKLWMEIRAELRAASA